MHNILNWKFTNFYLLTDHRALCKARCILQRGGQWARKSPERNCCRKGSCSCTQVQNVHCKKKILHVNLSWNLCDLHVNWKRCSGTEAGWSNDLTKWEIPLLIILKCNWFKKKKQLYSFIRFKHAHVCKSHCHLRYIWNFRDLANNITTSLPLE